jgi:DNA-binding Lrp family transcriptional regulator
VAPDPVDIRLLALVAESGRAAVHEIAGRLGMDPREVAARLVALSATGLPLLVGVECDANRLRAAIANAHQWPYPQPQPPQPGPVQGHPSGPYATGSGPYPGGSYAAAPGPYAGGSGPYPGGYAGGSGPYPPPPVQYQQRMPAPVRSGPPSAPFPAAAPAPTPGPPAGVDAISTWGPPQSASWARGDAPTVQGPPPAARTVHHGKVGDTLNTEGLDGEHVSIQLIEVVDPADFLFHAAGYRLQPGERSVVVHTELTNRGQVPYPTLPDLYLVLVSDSGELVRKAPVSLSSRPPHRIGVPPGETAGGHTVYVLPEATPITAVRWSPRPDDEVRALTWQIED